MQPRHCESHRVPARRDAVRGAGAMLAACLVALATWAASGCGGPAGTGLVGRWEGRPESAEAFQTRHATPPAAANPDDQTKVAVARAMASPPFPDPTELEQYNVRVVLDLAGDGSLTMWLDDGRDRRAGRWTATPVDERQTILQVATQPDDDRQPAERRRFELRWDPDHDGFTLREEGADPQLGWLYFRRGKS